MVIYTAAVVYFLLLLNNKFGLIASQTTSNPPFFYYGCFVESPNPANPILSYYNASMENNASAASCYNICQANNNQSTIFGTEAGNQCFCGQGYNTWIDFHVMDSYCNTNCTGTTQNEKCGGIYKTIPFISVYTAASNPFHQQTKTYGFFGCLVDNPNRNQSGVISVLKLNLSSTATQMNCMKTCLANDLTFTVFGMGEGGMCYCTDDFDSLPLMFANKSICNTPCMGNSQEKCGGHINNGHQVIPLTSLFMASTDPGYNYFFPTPAPTAAPIQQATTQIVTTQTSKQ